MLLEKYLKKIFKKVFFIQKSITFDISKATKQSNKPYQNEKFLNVTYWRGLHYCRHHSSNQNFLRTNRIVNACIFYRKLMKIIHLKNDIYQVVDELLETTFHQGTLMECQSFLLLYEHKDNPFLKEFLNLFNQKL